MKDFAVRVPAGRGWINSRHTVTPVSVPKEINRRIPYPSERDAENLITVSEVFRGMLYQVIDDRLEIYTRNNGTLAVPLKHPRNLGGRADGAVKVMR